MTDHYAVIGNPIHHSKSPFIHQAFARQTGEDIDYTAIEVPLDNLANSLKQLRDLQKLRGINVTVPFKEQVWALVDSRSERAERAGAVNTVVFNANGSLFGDNTDGYGLCQDLHVNHQIALKDKRILLLGAGGAARGVIAPLLGYQPDQLFIANRTASKAQTLATHFSHLGTVTGGGLDQLTGQFDVIINATAASLQGEMLAVSPDILKAESCCYDMMYGREETIFIQWAKQHGVTNAIDGLGMLVEQAAEAFYLWRGVRPETRPVIASLR